MPIYVCDDDVLFCILQLFSYKYFWHGIHRTLLARRQYATAPTYLYRFDFDSKHFNIMRIITCGRKVRGTCHADDLSYLFYNAAAKKLKYRTAEYTTIRRMVAILAKFAECGDPNIPLTDAVNWLTPLNDSSGVSSTANNSNCNKDEENTALPSVDNVLDAGTDCVNNEGNTNVQMILQQQKQQPFHHHNLEHTHPTHWPPIETQRTVEDAEDGNRDNSITFKCLNISDELEVIDLPESEKLKLWDTMYEDKSLLY